MTGTPKDGRPTGALDTSKLSCTRCVFGQRVGVSGVKVLNLEALYCYRYPPKLMVLPGAREECAVSVYPLVSAGMWCGEFVERTDPPPLRGHNAGPSRVGA